jgi:transposase-like protein
MTEERMALAELLQKSGDGDFLRTVAEAVLQILMEADVEGLIGAGRHGRTGDRLNYRNGYRDLASTRGWVRSSCAFPSCAKGRTSRRFWSRVRPPRRVTRLKPFL